MQKVKVLNFMISDSFGGIETYLSGAYQVINKEKVQMDFVATKENTDTVKKFREMGATVHIISSPRNISQYKRDIEKLFDMGYGVAYFHKNSAANIVPIKIAKKKNCKIIVHSHNVSPSQGRMSKCLHYINKANIGKLADRRFACSIEAQNWMFDNTKKCEIINNGIDTKLFRYNESSRRKIRTELGIPESNFVIGCVGRFVGFKNQRWLIQSVELLSDEITMLLVGDGRCLEECKALAHDLNKSSNIVFTGARDDVAELLCAMDIFVIPSIYEGFGIVAIEAQASGLLTFVSDGVPDTAVITDCTKRFSLDEKGAIQIQKAIDNRNCVPKQERERYCEIVKRNGFDMKDSYCRVEQIIREMCND